MHVRATAFTLIELLVVISIIALLIAILLPSLAKAREVAQQIQSGNQQRSVGLGLVLYAEDNGGYYAGFDSSGRTLRNYKGTTGRGIRVEHRYQMLLEGRYTAAPVLIAPVEKDRVVWNEDSGVNVTLKNYSYAMQINPYFSADGEILHKWGMNQEWSNTGNSQAVILGDRNTSAISGTVNINSIWSNRIGVWNGHVTWNDIHVTFEDDYVVDRTKYGNWGPNTNDHLFTSTGQQNSNALLIKYSESGTNTYGIQDGVQ